MWLNYHSLHFQLVIIDPTESVSQPPICYASLPRWQALTETACCFLAAACGDVGSEDRDEWMGEEYRILRTYPKLVEEYRILRTYPRLGRL